MAVPALSAFYVKVKRVVVFKGHVPEFKWVWWDYYSTKVNDLATCTVTVKGTNKICIQILCSSAAITV